MIEAILGNLLKRTTKYHVILYNLCTKFLFVYRYLTSIIIFDLKRKKKNNSIWQATDNANLLPSCFLTFEGKKSTLPGFGFLTFKLALFIYPLFGKIKKSILTL